jgi:SAM-dependent methyltransferase
MVVFMSDKLYWDNRYATGGNSGSGSRGELAMYKAEVINMLIEDNNIESMLDLGCGDGYQLQFYCVNSYYGFDISPVSILICKELEDPDNGVRFGVYNVDPLPTVDMAISMDVLFHITDMDALKYYLEDLFDHALKMVVIYAYDYDSSDKDRFSPHYKPVKFTSIIKEQHPDWMLSQHIENKFPVKEFGTAKGSYSDFYIYTPRLE